MKQIRLLLTFGASVLLAGALGVSCENDIKILPSCATDEECVEKNEGRPGWYCDKEARRCACGGEESCGLEEHCERLPGGDGRCHPNRICEWNNDCDKGQFCDVASGFCRKSGCTMDLQCNLGEICSSQSTCVPGCRSDGDCAYRQACLCPAEDGDGFSACECDATTEEGRMNCGVGQCKADTCTKDSHCEWGQICVPNPDPSNPYKVCVDDERGPFCGVCTSGAGDVYNRCGAPGNFCLSDEYLDGVGSYCGVNCINGESCPNGFSCSEILVRTQTACTSDASCKPHSTAPTCETDEDCPGGRCADGQCAGYCRGGEGAIVGWCSCVTDDECPTQTCNAQGYCTIDGQRCIDDADCRGQIVCQRQTVDGIELGYCKVGRNCARDEATCQEVREIRR